jgi:1,2-diacylglycerol 3-alpha-glucosyltransferase
MIQRIGILTNTYPPIRNGVSMAVVGLEQELTRAGIEVFIATPKVEGVIYPDNVFTFEAIDLPKDISADLKLAPVYTKKVAKFFKQKQIQLIHTCDTLFGGIEGAYIARELDIPSIHTFHTLVEDYKMVSFPAYHRILRKGIKEICNSYDHVIAPSTKVYKYLLGLTVTPISHIYNIPYLNSIDFIDSPKFENLENLGIKNDDFVFLTFCRLAKEKGLDLGINTLAPILKCNPQVKYVIAGQGPEKANLIEQAKQLGVDKQLIFIGEYSPENLEQIARNTRAKVFLFTSLSENLPTNLLEAMYLSLPVVAVDDESTNYLMKNGFNGYKDKLDNLFEHCLRLVYSQGLVNQMSQNAKQTATEFLEQDICQQHIKLYNKVIEDYVSQPKNSLLDLDDIFRQSLKKIKDILRKL